MSNKWQNNWGIKKNWKGILVSIGVSILVLLGATGLITTMISSETIPIGHTKGYAVAAVLLAAFAGALVTQYLTKDKSVISVAAFSGIYVFLRAATAILLFEGISSQIWFDLLAVIVGAVSGYIFYIKTAGKKQRRKRRYR